MRQINWGIIGLGAVASQFASGFKFVDNAKLLGIASKDLDKLKKFKENLKINSNYCFSNYQDLLENKDIDIVYIALPTSLHHEWIIKCLDEKKKVLVEKPATMNAMEIEDIKNRYITKEVFFNEAFMYMYHPQIKKTLELINQGEIGELTSMQSNFGTDILTKKNLFGFKKIKKLNPKNRIFNKKLGGGVILDLGCYPVSLSTLIASQISEINYDNVKILNVKKDIGSVDIEINSSIELIFENNFRSKIGVSYSQNLGNKTIIAGTKGELIIQDTWAGEPSIINLKKEKDTAINVTSNQNIYSYEINFLSDCILNNRLKPSFPRLTIDSTVGNMKIIDMWIN